MNGISYTICPTSYQVVGNNNPMRGVPFERGFRNQYSKLQGIHYNLDKLWRITVLTHLKLV
jgi:hypothetical protein